MWVGLFGDSQRNVLSSVPAFLYSAWFVVSNTKIPIGVGLNHYFREGNDQPSLAKREIAYAYIEYKFFRIVPERYSEL